MKALIFDGKLSIQSIPMPVPSPGEAVIKILYSSVCNTDLEIIKGYMGFNGVLGHEFAGEVVEGSNSLKGRRVVGEINCSCGGCEMCRRNRPTHCTQRSVLGIFNHNGAFAEHLVLPEKNLHVIPDSIESDEAVFTEPLAAALEIFEQLHVKITDSVFIFGVGKLGMLIAQSFHAAGHSYTAWTRNDIKAEMARRLGLHCRQIGELLPEFKADICVECTGSPDGLALAISHIHPRGTIVQKSTVANPPSFDLNQVVINELTILGSRCGAFAPALQMLERKQISVRPMISKVFNFADAVEAFEYAQKKDVMKVLVKH